MPFIRTAVCCLVFPATAFFCQSVVAQKPSWNRMISLDRIFGRRPWSDTSRPVRPSHPRPPLPPPLPVTRWILSFNPYGVLEGPCALGAGLGYRLNRDVELWSETSFLTNGFMRTEGPVTGIRQIIQAKFFVYHSNFFVAAELRYKSYQYRDKEDFYNPVTKDSLMDRSTFGRHYFYGGGFQLGWRGAFTKNKRFQLEISVGLGARKLFVHREDVPQGYQYRDFDRSIDIKVTDLQKSEVYLPGSVRLVYCFGKLLRP